MLKAVLFDLDGTLLPMDQEVFIKTYLGHLAKRLAQHGYVPEKLIEAIWTGTMKMVANTGEKRNEEVFWDCFAGIFGEKVREDLPLFDEFYQTDFDLANAVCGFTADSAAVIRDCKEAGLQVVLATNPIFPAIATEKRIAWAGLSPQDFELYTTYENSRFSKPNLNYYRDIADSLGLAPEECLMVGNDVSDDMPAQKLGMQVFLLTDCLINKNGEDISQYPNGDFATLRNYIQQQAKRAHSCE